VAGDLRNILRPTDTISRFDPDTFYILIEDILSGEVAIDIAIAFKKSSTEKSPLLDTKSEFRSQ
jgi:PleD family two-component response regulator